ncbi:MAG: hypothetical protein ACJ78W_07845, partial [Myxococcales bacterium]
VVLETVVVVAVAAIVVATVVRPPIVVVALLAAPIVPVTIVAMAIVTAVPVAPVVTAAVAAAVVAVPVPASVAALIGQNGRSGKRCCSQDGHAETAHVCLLVDCKIYVCAIPSQGSIGRRDVCLPIGNRCLLAQRSSSVGRDVMARQVVE